MQTDIKLAVSQTSLSWDERQVFEMAINALELPLIARSIWFTSMHAAGCASAADLGWNGYTQ